MLYTTKKQVLCVAKYNLLHLTINVERPGINMNAKKYKIEQVGHILHHSWKNWERTLNNEKIDHTKNHLNYQITRDGDSAIVSKDCTDIKKLIKAETGRAVRKDAVLLGSIMITKPSNVTESDEKQFFDEVFNFFKERLLKAKLDLDSAHLTGFVHVNESTPQMHLQFIPVQKTENGHKLNAKNIISRSLLSTMHDDLIKYLEPKLGYKPQLLIDEEHSIDKMLGRYGLDNKDYQKVKNALTQDLRREKEYLRQGVDQQKQRIAEIDNSIETAKVQSSSKAAIEKINWVEHRIEKFRGRIQEIRAITESYLKGIADTITAIRRNTEQSREPAPNVDLGHGAARLTQRVKSASSVPSKNKNFGDNRQR